MRTVVVLAASLVALAACNRKPPQQVEQPKVGQSGAPAEAAKPAAAPAAMPMRAPGLWEQKITTADFDQTSRICLDRAVAEKTAVWGQRPGESACARTVTPRLGGGWDFTATCDLGTSGKTTTKGSVTGDFAKSYKVTAETNTTGGANPQMDGTRRMTLEATWQGPCPAGMAAGDMLLPNGMKINMMQMRGG
jgi:hypothetical protein